MALPFLAGLILGGGAVFAYNNRAKISKSLQDAAKDIEIKKPGRRGRKPAQALVSEAEATKQVTKTRKPRKPRAKRATSTTTSTTETPILTPLASITETNI
ncbi:hypothetical protein [uncultured Helicobacter sp.]|uniref:hypothetical protein n=1 Tax=uncultured Helicobacter sp. TaxID=175537 RepID=UPI0037528E39